MTVATMLDTRTTERHQDYQSHRDQSASLAGIDVVASLFAAFMTLAPLAAATLFAPK